MSVDLRPGWVLTLVAMAAGGLTAALIPAWSVSGAWVPGRLAVMALLGLTVGLAVGSSGLVGAATVPALAAAAIGLDRPAGHAWGQVLLVAVLWYVTTELAWTAIEWRDGTRRSTAVHRLRVREVATVVAVAIVVGFAGSAAAGLDPARTAIVRGLAVAVVLAALLGLGRHLRQRSRSAAPAAHH